jgi:2'-hydroxyisoflavone reductase
MRILILGGTIFLGRALVEAALEGGHSVTLFNRGQSNPGLFPGVEQLHGDRSVSLAAIEGCCWDAAIDTSGYLPRVVDLSASYLSNKVDHYTFISSLSVYDDPSHPGIDENGHLGSLKDETIETVDGETYGPLKVLCERAAEAAMPGRVLIVRPGLIVGPFDPTDRFTYWPHRVALGGEILAPGPPQRAVQFIDVHDLAGWIIHAIETNQTGTFNAVGPEYPLPMQALLDDCREASARDARFTWVSEDFLTAQNVEPWREMPLWVPESDPVYAGFFTFSNHKAVSAGLTFRPASETVAAVLAWDASRPSDHAWKAGLQYQREIELLQTWHQLPSKKTV